jgi:hypothetical protein
MSQMAIKSVSPSRNTCRRSNAPDSEQCNEPHSSPRSTTITSVHNRGCLQHLSCSLIIEWRKSVGTRKGGRGVERRVTCNPLHTSKHTLSLSVPVARHVAAATLSPSLTRRCRVCPGKGRWPRTCAAGSTPVVCTRTFTTSSDGCGTEQPQSAVCGLLFSTNRSELPSVWSSPSMEKVAHASRLSIFRGVCWSRSPTGGWGHRQVVRARTLLARAWSSAMYWLQQRRD